MELIVNDIILLVNKIKTAKVELAAQAHEHQFIKEYYDRIHNDIHIPTQQLKENSLQHIFTLVEYIEDNLCYEED